LKEENKIKNLYSNEPEGNPMVIATRLMRNLPENTLFKTFEIITHYMKQGKIPKEDNDGS